MHDSRSLTFYGLAIALAMILSYVESLIPYGFGIPGIKIGLPNVVILFVLYRRHVKGAAAVSLIRVFLTALLFGNLMSLAYSLTGAVFSLTVMAVLKKKGVFGLIGVSVAGAVSHNLGQILAAMVLLGNRAIGAYFPILMMTGTLAGVLIGVCGGILVCRLN